MKMNRREFAVAVAVVPVTFRPRWLTSAVPVLYGDGIHDDTAALQAWFDGLPVVWSDGTLVGDTINNCSFIISSDLIFTGCGTAPRNFDFNCLHSKIRYEL